MKNLHFGISKGLLATVTVAAITAYPHTAAQAAVACTEAALIAAINTTQGAGGGTISLTPGCTYTLTTSHGRGTHGPDGLPIIHTPLALTGTNNIIIRASHALPFRIAEVSNTGNFTLTGVTLNNGHTADDGGGILNFGAVTLTGSGLTNNTATGEGGGLNNGTGAAATLTSSSVLGNTATAGGGGLNNGLRGTLTMTSTPVTLNRSAGKGTHGGGIAAKDSAATTLTSSPVSANTAADDGGGIFRLRGVMTITTSPITNNTPNNCVGSSPAVPNCIN